jgi:hypothetical protein
MSPVSIYPSRRNGAQQDLIVDTRLQRGIKKQDNQVEFGKQLYGALLSVAMSPTYLQPEPTFEVDDCDSKSSISISALLNFLFSFDNYLT